METDEWPDPGYTLFGIGRAARRSVMRVCGELRSGGTAAAALFKQELGGWIVRIYPRGIRRRDQAPAEVREACGVSSHFTGLSLEPPALRCA